jgi:asparagine synthase (glutamine-hydrolysing)
MCGITGFHHLSATSDPASLLSAMTASLQRRGPDAQATWLSPSGETGLGHTRLSIIDLSCGHQPMSTEDGRYTIAFNGEIYNYAALREELMREGSRFRTHSDTEVLLEAYRRWGRESLERLHGMFAFALYDAHEDRLFLARDATGIKPLYIAQTGSGLFFGSEIKAVLAAPSVPRRLNPEALFDFLVLGYPILPKTGFADVQEMRPGTWIEVAGGKVTEGAYWRWARNPVEMDEGEALERTEDALLKSLEEHLVSDVPLGAFLSGGIDSSLIVALLSKKLGVRIQSFNIKFAEAEYDESPYARMVAQEMGLEHHEIPLERSEPDLEGIKEIVRQFDQPFGDSSALPTYFICQEIRKHVKVALAGDGGDEMFGGYSRFQHAQQAKALGAKPWMPGLLQAASCGLRPIQADRCRQVRKMARIARSRGNDRLLALSSYFSPEEMGNVLAPRWADALSGYAPPLFTDAYDQPGGEEFRDATVRVALPGDYLRKVDVMSSAHGLEVRVPLLGKQVLDCSAKLPRNRLYSKDGNKLLLRKLAEKYLPEAVVNKPKAGFGIPLDSWLGESGRREIGDALLSPQARVREFIRGDCLQEALSGFVHQTRDAARQSRYNRYQQVYFLWSLELWLERWNPDL